MDSAEPVSKPKKAKAKAAKKKKRGPAPFKPRAQHRRDVQLYVACGISEPAIAQVLGICQNTLRKHFALELETGRDVKRAQNSKRLDDAAEKGNVAAIKALAVQMDKALPSDPDLRPDLRPDLARRAPAAPAEAPVAAEPPAPKTPKLGKKEQAALDAKTAGLGTEWGDDLTPNLGGRPLN